MFTSKGVLEHLLGGTSVVGYGSQSALSWRFCGKKKQQIWLTFLSGYWKLIDPVLESRNQPSKRCS